MKNQILTAAVIAVGFVYQVHAQDAYYPNQSISAERSNLVQDKAATVVVIAGTKKGKCTPEMPMLDRNETYEIQLQATADKTFVLDNDDFNMHLRAEPGKTASQVITPTTNGDFNFVCGDEVLPPKKRTQGMFMVMDM